MKAFRTQMPCFVMESMIGYETMGTNFHWLTLKTMSSGPSDTINACMQTLKNSSQMQKEDY